MPNFKKTLTAAEFARIGDLALHESWQMILATGMRVDLATINSWAKSGTPADITESLLELSLARVETISRAPSTCSSKSPSSRGNVATKF